MSIEGVGTAVSGSGVVGPEAVGTLQVCPDRVRLYHRETGRRLLMPCRRRQCLFCGAKYWRPRVLAGLHSGLGDESADFLALLLTAPGGVPAWVFNPTASACWNRFTTYLRRAWGKTYPDLQYWRVAELQERGHVHFHVVLRGARYLPISNASGTGLRDLAVRAGFGTWVGIRRPRDYPGGVRSVGSYFGKYLLKAYTAAAGVRKVVTFSQGWRQSWITRKREGVSEWLFVGSAGASWDRLGQVVEPGRRRIERPRVFFAPWWRASWQASKARWAETVGLFGL